MPGRSERILELDLDVAAAERQAARTGRRPPRARGRPRVDQQPGLEILGSSGPETAVVHAGGVGGGARLASARRSPRPRRRSRSALKATHSQEQVQDGEEAELEADGDRRVSSCRTPARRSAGGPELDPSPGLSTSALDAAAVEPRSVGRAEVGEHPGAAVRPDLGVVARHVGVVDHHVALAAAAERRAPGPTTTRRPPMISSAVCCAERARSQRLGQPLGGAVDHRAAPGSGSAVGGPRRVRLARRPAAAPRSASGSRTRPGRAAGRSRTG